MRAFRRRVDYVLEIIRAELTPHHRRIRNTIRMATIGTVGAGVMAACHIQSVLGTYIIWTLVGSAGPMMGFGEAFAFTIAAGALMALSVPLAGILAETPWLLLPFLGGTITLMSYTVTTRRFGSPGLVLKVVVIDTFYNVVFYPHTFAETTASTFGGTALAFGILALFDTWIWPNPAEVMLLESLAISLEKTRARLASAAEAYLDPRGDRLSPNAPPLSDMAKHLDLLERCRKEGATPFRSAVLLATIYRAERLHNEVDRMVIIVREKVPRELRAMMRQQLTDAIAAIAAAIDELAREIPREIPIGPELPPLPVSARVKPAMDALDAATLAARPAYIVRCPADEVINYGAFNASLIRLADLIGRRLDHPQQSAADMKTKRWYELGTVDLSLLHYGIKVGLAIVIGYSVGVISHHENLSVILTTVIIAGLPTYGATLHKMILRLFGNIVGGGLALLAIIIVTPNFETLPVYMLTFAIVFSIAGYAALASGNVAYAGKQIATAFVLTFAGLSPTAAIDEPLYRVWGIILGVLVVGSVFFTIWPEYAGDSLMPRLRKAFIDTLELIPGTPVSVSTAKLDATSDDITRTLYELLGVVDDARLEGARSRIDPGAVVDATGQLRRIAHRFARIDAERLLHTIPPLSTESAECYAEFLAAVRSRLAGWLDFFSSDEALNARAAAAFAARYHPEDLTRPLEELNQRVSANQFAETSSWTLEQRRIMTAELQSYHRVTELAAELDAHLALIPRA